MGLVLGVAFGLGLLLVLDARFGRRDSAGITWTNTSRAIRRLGPRGAGALAGGAVGLIATGWLMAGVAGAIVGAVVPEMVVRGREERERIARMEAVSEVASRIRDSLRSGIALQEAISMAAKSPPPAIAHELRRLAADMKIEGIDAAVSSLSRRGGDFSSEVLAAALSLSERFGARNTADVLDALSEATTSRALTLREARARQTHNRVSARIVVATPVLLLLIIQRTSPAYLEPFGTPVGQLVLALAFALMGIGYWAMLRAARIEGAET